MFSNSELKQGSHFVSTFLDIGCTSVGREIIPSLSTEMASPCSEFAEDTFGIDSCIDSEVGGSDSSSVTSGLGFVRLE